MFGEDGGAVSDAGTGRPAISLKCRVDAARLEHF